MSDKVQIGEATLYCGDCRDILPDLSVDAVITDPPYGTTNCSWDDIIPLGPLWRQLNSAIKPNGVIIITASQPFTTVLIHSNIKMFKYCLTWEKDRPSNPALAKKRPLKYTEDIAVFYKIQPTYNPQKTKRPEKNKRNNKNEKFSTESSAKLGDSFKKQGLSDYCYPKDILKINVQRGLHPTQKPVELMEYLVKTYTNETELVLDFTMGSGTTGVACANLGRKFIGIELEPKYFDIACERIEAAYAQGRLFD